MKMNGNEILQRLAASKKTDREKVSLYLSRSLYERFKSVCNEIPASLVMEELILSFLQSTEDNDPKHETQPKQKTGR